MIKKCIAPQNIDNFQNSGGPGLQNIQPNNYYYLKKNPMDNEYVFFFFCTCLSFGLPAIVSGSVLMPMGKGMNHDHKIYPGQRVALFFSLFKSQPLNLLHCLVTKSSLMKILYR